MAEKRKPTPKNLSASNTKQEMLDAYGDLVKQMEEKRAAEQRPQEKVEEKRIEKAVQAADSLSTEGIAEGIAALKSELGRTLGQISDRLEEAVGKYRSVCEAIKAKEQELRDIYEIQKQATSLAALLDLQRVKREDFETEMSERGEALDDEALAARAEWEKEKKLHLEELKEREAQEKKRREREKEEHDYAFNRERDLARRKLDDELAAIEGDLKRRRDQLEKELADRERLLAEREGELAQLRARAEGHPKDLEAAVARAVKEATDRARQEATAKEQLALKGFEGERNVMASKIEALDKTVKEQAQQIAKLGQQLEKAYGQVQDVAVKALEGSSASKSLASLQQMIAEQGRKPVQEK